MRRMIFCVLVALLLSLPAAAANEMPWPYMLHDADCTDANDTVSAANLNSAHQTNLQDTVGGGADGLCDYDLRVSTGAITVDTLFGPLNAGNYGTTAFLHVNATVVSGSTLTWNINLRVPPPEDTGGTSKTIDTTVTATGVVDEWYQFGQNPLNNGSFQDIMQIPMPRQFYIQLNLGTATSWQGVIGLLPTHSE